MARIYVYGILLFMIAAALYGRYNSEPRQEEPSEEVRTETDQAQKTVEDKAASGDENLPVIRPSLPPPVVSPEESAGQDENNGLRARANEKIREKDYTAASYILRELSLKDRAALTPLGICYYNMGDLSSAVSTLEQASEFNPKDFAARKLLAFIYYGRDDLQNSRRHAEAALSISEDGDLRSLISKLSREDKTQAGYLEESSDHFKVMYDGYEHGRVSREILGLLEDAYRHVGRELNYYPSIQVTAILYSGKDFFNTTQAPEWSGGIYDGKIRIPVRNISGKSALLRKVVYHEYVHAAIRSLTSACPMWLNEGLADNLSGGCSGRTAQVIPLSMLENSFFNLSASSIPIAYAESCSAVSWLSGKYGLYRIKDFLSGLSEGKDAETSFRDSFGIGYSEFKNSWGKN